MIEHPETRVVLRGNEHLATERSLPTGRNLQHCRSIIDALDVMTVEAPTPYRFPRLSELVGRNTHDPNQEDEVYVCVVF